MRLVDADALIGTLHNVTFEDGTDREIVYRCVELAPTIEERKMGKWFDTVYLFRCSECNGVAPIYGGMITKTKYCPHCGARMEVDDRT